jgi:hypothetical protein
MHRDDALVRPLRLLGKKNPLDTVTRFFETGPWGPAFDRLTWLPWWSLARGEPKCLFVDSSGDSHELQHSAIPLPPPGHKRCVIISDTHGKHRLLHVPAGDVLFHAGDLLSRNACTFSNNGTLHAAGLAALRDFNSWLGGIPIRHKVVIGGNHDATLEKLGADQASKLLSNAMYLQDSGADIDGLHVFGTPWSPMGKSRNRAFQSAMLPSPLGEKAIDVLLSHCYHPLLAKTLQPSLYVSGHAHNHHGILPQEPSIQGIAVNASICDETYRAVQLPIVIDILPGTRKT